jgi:uncharacterized protein YqgC (DUF456 family)
LDTHDVVALLVVILGLGGVILPILPGMVLQVVAVLGWAVVDSSTVAWVVAGLALVTAAGTFILKYLYPGRKLKEAGIPTWVLAVAVILGALGFFVIPIVGAPLAFIGTVFVFEWVRRGRSEAWPSTRSALYAIAQSIGIELAGGSLITLLIVLGILLA